MKNAAIDLEKLFTEVYILHCIGELDSKTSERLMKQCAAFSYDGVDDAIRDFEQSESITIALVEWVKSAWEESQDLTPKQFVRSIFDDFRASIE